MKKKLELKNAANKKRLENQKTPNKKTRLNTVAWQQNQRQTQVTLQLKIHPTQQLKLDTKLD